MLHAVFAAALLAGGASPLIVGPNSLPSPYASDITLGASNCLDFNGRSSVCSGADSYLDLYEADGAGFTAIRFGGTTSSFPGLFRNSAGLWAKLADNSAGATFWAKDIAAYNTAASNSTVSVLNSAGNAVWYVNQSDLTVRFGTAFHMKWSSDAVPSSNFVLGLEKYASGVMQVTDGGTGTGKILTAHATGTIAADDTTPDVSGGLVFTTSANTGATAITDLDSPTAGQVVRVCGGSDTNPSTIADSGNFNLVGPFVASLNNCITLLVEADNDYIELGRTNNGTEVLLGSASIDTSNNSSKQNVFTCPTGVTCVITRNVFRSPSAAISAATYKTGWDASGSDVVSTTSSLTSLSATNKTVIQSPYPGAEVGAAGEVYGYYGQGAEGAADTVTIDVYGYYY